MEKSIYAISGYVVEDENFISVDVYKLIKYGKEDVRYAWVRINGTETGGIGTLTNEFGVKEMKDAFIQIVEHKDEYFTLLEGTFDEAVTRYQNLKIDLQSKLKK